MDTAFIRSSYIAPVFKGVEAHYGISLTDLSIPEALFDEGMELIPFNEASKWFTQLETLTGEADYMVKIQCYLDISALKIPGNWFLSAPDLAMCFRRINHGICSFHSGASYYPLQSGNILKWCYNNPYAKERARSHDSLRVAITLFNAIKRFSGNHYRLKKLRLSGPPIKQQETEAIFGCPVSWNAAQTELWISVDDLFTSSPMDDFTADTLTSSVSLAQFEKYLNMPQPTDLPKVLYEMVNYSRYYGLPTVVSVANLFGISRQQLQRRLQKVGLSFTDLSGYILCNQAIKYMLEGKEINEIAQRLGYANAHSFSRSFARFRQQTPTQYMNKINRQNKKPL
ncbi:AraC family transcriptional regulator [Shewanella gelidimarina]|uniref:AraC family transcriptional regulator n=1 Tax=Shewanella gelidimarina TaxID=56813 RepID=UPI00200D5811|nr:AraC family transcriptional regulator [Shewanella gelidimarina]MCL1056559.1 AraC family transcriptional regulator [Shewanella gelidimarina]